MDYEVFLMLIPKGEENRITSKEIESLTGMKGAEVRATVNALRTEGHPIASDGKGYYMAVTQSEILKTIRNLDSRINAINKAKTGLKKAMFNLIFQEENERDARENHLHNTNTTENKEESPATGPA